MRSLIRAAVALVVAMVPLAVLDGSGSASSAPRHIGVARHGPVVRPASFDGNLRHTRATDVDRFRIHPEPRTPPSPAPRRPSVDVPVTASTTVPATSAPAPTATSFDGLDFTNWGDGHPPDTVGDVGPNVFVQAVNTSFAVYSKTGTKLAAATFNTLWSTAPDATAGLCKTDNFGDPTVVYDPMSDRWVVADFAFAGDGTVAPYYECIAVSKTSDPVAGGWWLYAVRTDDAAHPWLADYPKMGIWPSGLYMSANMFSPTAFEEVRVWAFNRSDLESGSPLRQVVVDLGSSTEFGLLPANLRGELPPAGTDELFVAESQTAWAFEVYKFHVDYTGNTSSVTAPVDVAQTPYNLTRLPLVSTPGNGLDSLSDRLMMQAQYRNFGGTESVWVTHTVRMSSKGPYGMQWAQIDVTGGAVATTAVQQQIYGNLGSDGVDRWMGSVAVDDRGDMALGYSAASSSLDPAIRYAGRLVGDPLGTLPRTETSMTEGSGTQVGNCGGATCTRWGDYSAMTIDPTDGCTFWYTNEYYAVDGLDWHTRIGSFAFPSCTSPATVTTPAAATATYGGTTTLSATLTSTGNPVAGRTIDFSVNGVAKGNAVTGADGVATLSNVSIAGINAGSYAAAVSASFAGDDVYPPSSGTASLTVSKADQTITFSGAPASATYNSSFPVTATATSGLTVAVAATGACSVSGLTVTMTSGTGSCSLTADQPGNGNYNPATQATQSTTAQKASQSVTLTVPASKVTTDAPFSVSGAATSGLAVVLGIGSGPCTISGSTVTITGAGDCVVTGDQGGDSNWLAASTATATVSISKAPQTITFSAIAAKTFGDADFAVSATSSSGLPVTFSVLPDDPCTISGSTIHIVHAGTCHVTASQSGDGTYNSATPVERDVTINPAGTSVAVTISHPSVQYSDELTLTGTVSPGTVTGQVRFAIGATTLATVPVSGGVATATPAVEVSPGARSITATFVSGDGDHAGSVGSAPVTVKPENASVTASAPLLVFTSSPTTGTRTLRLRTVVRDAADGSPGDVRRARVTFLNRSTGAAFASCRGLAVALTTPGDFTNGVARCTTTVKVPATPAGSVYRVGVRVGGNYTRDSGLDDTVVTAARPLARRLAAAGSALRLTSSAGSLAGTRKSTALVGLTARWSKDRSVRHGAAVVLLVHSGRRLLARTTSLTGVTGSRPRLSLRWTAVVTDVTGPGTPKVLAKGARLVVRLVDGSPDKIAVELRSRRGKLLFASRWSGSATLLQALARGAVVER